ncbi:MAG: FHA domain-containing serine/threonine-protein kinase [Planctomycetota bacterium]
MNIKNPFSSTKAKNPFGKDRYKILNELGKGGQGIVYKALDTTNGSEVALKRANPSIDKKHRSLIEARLEREAIFPVQHRNLITAIDFGLDEDGYYVVFPLAPGKDLIAHAQDGWLASDDEVLHIVQSVTEGLAAIHKAGYQHRDVKPHNILCDLRAKKVFLIDLGMVTSPGASTRLTRPDQPIGTLAFASPEAIKSPCQHDPRSDLHAIGCLIYWFYSGQSPFDAASEAEAIQRVTQEVPRRLTEINPATPPIMASLAEGLLAKNPNDRWPQTANAVIDTLQGGGQNPSAARPPQRSSSCPRCLACGSPSPNAERCSVCGRFFAASILLKCQLPDGRTRDFRLPMGRYPVGRHEISRSNPCVSRRQAEVLVTSNEVSVRHLDGRNLTLVDGQAASRRQPIRVKNQLQFANVVAELHPQHS